MFPTCSWPPLLRALQSARLRFRVTRSGLGRCPRELESPQRESSEADRMPNLRSRYTDDNFRRLSCPIPTTNCANSDAPLIVNTPSAKTSVLAISVGGFIGCSFDNLNGVQFRAVG